jgi:hypothetical protein
MTTQRCVRLVAVCVLFVAACGNVEKSKYQAVANAANAKIAVLRDIVAPVLATGASDTAVVAACFKAEDTVRELQDVDFRDRELSGKIGQTDAGAVIRTLIEMRRDKCQEDSGDGTRTRRCRNWCVDRWERLADAMDRLHTAAASNGVQIERLRSEK